MKTQEEIREALTKYKPLLHEKFGVKELGVFGSYSRGQASEASDVDILVDFDRPIGWEVIDLTDFLEQVFGKRVDLVTKNALKPQLKEKILGEVVYA